MKILKLIVGVSLVGLFVYLLMIVIQSEKNEEHIDPTIPIREEVVNLKNSTDSLEIDTLKQNVTSIFDLKAVFEKNQLLVYQLDQPKFQEHIPINGFLNIISSDLNLDEQAEFWLLFKQNKKMKILGFQWEKSKLIPLNFPEIKGRQKLGYIGNDSLYLEKGLLVRDFQFVNDPFAELANGFRKCYYTFGKDKSFVLQKTIDYEKR